MTISIEVYRGAGSVRGPDITDHYIGSDACALSRGRAALDESAHRRSRVETVALHRPGVRVGQLVRVGVEGEPLWTGQVSRVRHIAADGQLLTMLSIEKIMEN